MLLTPMDLWGSTIGINLHLWQQYIHVCLMIIWEKYWVKLNSFYIKLRNNDIFFGIQSDVWSDIFWCSDIHMYRIQVPTHKSPLQVPELIGRELWTKDTYLDRTVCPIYPVEWSAIIWFWSCSSIVLLTQTQTCVLLGSTSNQSLWCLRNTKRLL